MAEKKHYIDPAKIHLKRIEELYTDIAILPDNFQFSSLDTKIAHKSAYNISQNRFLLGLKVVFKAVDTENQPDCSFRVNFHFEIENIEEMFNYNENDIPEFKEVFVATLAGISYSTLRGMIYEKTINSPWNGILLPVINPTKLLSSWIENE